MPYWTVPDRDGRRQMEEVDEETRVRWTIYGPYSTIDEADERCSHLGRRPGSQMISVDQLKLTFVQRCSSDRGDIGEGTRS